MCQLSRRCASWRRTRLVAVGSLVISVLCAAAFDPTPVIKRGKELEAQGKYAEAVVEYDKLVAVARLEATAHFYRGRARYLAGNHEGALEDLEFTCMMNPKDANALGYRGLANRALKSLSSATADFKAAVAADPTKARWHYELATCLLDGNQPAEALPELNEAIRLSPKTSDFYLVRAVVHEKLAQRDEGLADCAKLRELVTEPSHLAKVDALQARLMAINSEPVEPLIPVEARKTNAGAAAAAKTPTRVSLTDEISLSVDSSENPSSAEQVPAPAGEVNFAKDIQEPAAQPTASVSSKGPVRKSSLASFAPIQLPPPMDLSNLNAQQWAGIVAQTKDGMAMIYGELTAAQQKAFDKEWAPYFEFPCQEVLDYFQKLSPLVAEFVQVKEAYGRTALAADKAQAELLSAISTEDAEEVISLSQDLKHFRGILASCGGRISQLAAEVTKLGPTPKPLELKKQAKKHHKQIIDDILKPEAALTGSIEGTWVGSREGKSEKEYYTYKIEQQLSTDLLLVRQNSNEPILMEPLPQGNAWICVEIKPGQEPDEAYLSRLEIRGGILLRRIFGPPFHAAPHDYSKYYPGDYWPDFVFKTTLYTPGNRPKPLGKSYPLPMVDDDNKPINWTKIYGDCILARADEIRVLREGGLSAANESARRHEYASLNADPISDNFDDVVSRMALEKGIGVRKETIDKKEALTRLYELFMNEQFYYYGDQPPGFDNLRSYEVSIPAAAGGLRPDMEARVRREGLLPWNLRKNLEIEIKSSERYELSLQGLDKPPEELAKTKDEFIRYQKARIASLRKEQADKTTVFSDEYYDQQVQETNAHIAESSSGEFERHAREFVAQARKRVEAEYMLPARILGIGARLDKELPTTAGRAVSGGVGAGSTGGSSLELTPGLRNVSPDESITAAMATPPPAPVIDPNLAAADAKKTADELAKQEAEKLEKQTKETKKAFLKEEIDSNLRSVEVLEKSLAATEASAMSAPDKEKELNQLQRSIQQLRSWNQTAEDNIRFVDTGVFERTRTPSDELNAQLMREDSRAQASYWDNINNKIVRMNRLIDAASVEVRDDLRHRWNDELESEIKSGAKFENIDAAAKAIGEAVINARQAESGQANRELAITERNLAIAEGVKTAAGYSMTAVTMYATAGLASPVSVFMPTCAETAISTTYSIATGYIEGGPEAAFKQAAGAYSQVAGLFNTAMDAYQQGVLDHLEDYARDPKNKQLNETGAGLSAMGWALAKEGVQNAATHFVINPILANTKEALKGPAKFATGAFGKDPMTFKSAAQMTDERRFTDKSLYGKHLMMQFKQAHEEYQAAKTSGKTPAELGTAKARMDSAYKEANSDFHAKNWMKRTARLNEDLGAAWSQTDSTHKAELMKVTAELNRADGLTTPPIKSYSNSASKGGVGMDMDLGFEEPSRWKQVPDPKNPGKTIPLVNPEYWAWRNKLRITDPATGAAKPISPREYSQKAHENMLKAYEKVYGQKPDEAFLEFTYADHPEAYKDKAWLGTQDKTSKTAWADFASINPDWAQQASDVTAFKVYRLQKPDPKKSTTKATSAAAESSAPGTAAPKDEFPGMPRYSAMLEQCRGLVKDFDTKMIGAKADTAGFGNEAGTKITINPESPLAKTPPEVQKHFLELRTVLNDFANGKIRPSEAEMKLNILTGGQGIVEVPEQMRAVMYRFAQEPARK